MLIAFFLGFGTIIFPYSGVTHHDIYGTFFSFLSFYLLFYRYRISDKHHTILVALAGVSMGIALFCSMLQVPILAFIVIYLILNKKPKEIMIFAFFFLIGMLPTFIFNWTIFGNPFNFPNIVGSATDTIPGFSVENTFAKLRFYLISPSNAILFYSPIFIIALVGFFFFKKKYHHEKIAIPLVFFIQLIHLSMIQTVGHSQFGPRYLLPSMPFILLGLCGFFSSNKLHKWVKSSIVALIFLFGFASIIINMTGSMIGVMYHSIDKHAAILYVNRILTGDLPIYPFFYFGLFLVGFILVLVILNFSSKKKRINNEK